MVDAAHEKETRAKETIQSLKMEISNLSKLVEQGAGLSVGQEHRWEGDRITGIVSRKLSVYYIYIYLLDHALSHQDQGPLWRIFNYALFIASICQLIHILLMSLVRDLFIYLLDFIYKAEK